MINLRYIPLLFYVWLATKKKPNGKLSLMYYPDNSLESNKFWFKTCSVFCINFVRLFFQSVHARIYLVVEVNDDGHLKFIMNMKSHE